MKKNKVKKKLTELILVFAVAVTVFGVCKDFFFSSQNDKVNEYTLTVWAYSNANIESMKRAAEIYSESHPGFKIEVVDVTETDIRTKLTIACVANDLSVLPDIFLMRDIYYPKFVNDFPQIFHAITDTGIEFEKFIKGKLNYSVVDGENYGIPFDNGCAIACYRMDYLKEAGFSIEDLTDKTWAEVIAVGKKVKENTGHPLFTCVAGTPDIVMTMVESCGQSVFQENGTVYIKDNQELKEAIKLYVEAVHEGVIREVTSYNQYIAALNGGTTVGTIKGNWIMQSIESADDQSGQWRVTNLPALNNSCSSTHFALDGGSSWAVSSNCKNFDVAVDFLKSTIGTNTSFYVDILQDYHVVPSYLPAYEDNIFSQKLEWWGNENVYEKIGQYSEKIPVNKNLGAYYADAKEAIGVAVSNIIQKHTDIDTELGFAEETVEFAMY